MRGHTGIFHRKAWLAPVLAAMALGAPLGAACAAEPAPSGYVMPDTEVWEIASDQGQTYRIFVSKPSRPAPPGGFPVLYVLDGNAMFAGFAETRRIQDWIGEGGPPQPGIADSIVVGIGYPTDQSYDLLRRLYDFTPEIPDPPPHDAAQLAQYKTGGNDQFLAFLLDRLRPEVARRYTIDSDRQSLYGHSLGGLFALHVLYTHPHAFNAIVAASPSQWWNDQANLVEERAFAEGLRNGRIHGPIARLMIVAGGREDNEPNLWDSRSLAKRLEPLSGYGLRSLFEEYADETHLTVPSRSVTATLRFAFGQP